MNLRPITPLEHSSVIQLIRDLILVAPQLKDQGFNWTDESVKSEMSQAQSVGAFEEGRLLGILIYRKLPSAFEVSLLATHPDHQRQGIMARLMRSLAEPGRNIWLEVHEKNYKALKFYEKMGMKRVGLRPGYYSDGGSCILMASE